MKHNIIKSIMIMMMLMIVSSVVIAEDEPSNPNPNIEDTAKEQSSGKLFGLFSGISSFQNKFNSFIDLIRLIFTYLNFFLAVIMFFFMVFVTIWLPVKVGIWIKPHMNLIKKITQLSSSVKY